MLRMLKYKSEVCVLVIIKKESNKFIDRNYDVNINNRGCTILVGTFCNFVIEIDKNKVIKKSSLCFFIPNLYDDKF